MTKVIRVIVSVKLWGEEVVALKMNEEGYNPLFVKRVLIDPEAVNKVWKDCTADARWLIDKDGDTQYVWDDPNTREEIDVKYMYLMYGEG